MENETLAKLNQLSPGLKAKLSTEEFLAQLDELSDQYGVKAVLIILDLLLDSVDYAALPQKLQADYGFNDFLAEEVKEKFGRLIEELGRRPAADEPAQKLTAQMDRVRPTAMPARVLPRPASSPSAASVFSREDEAEIKKYLRPVGSATAVDYEAQAQKIIVGFGYRAADEIMAKRLANIVISRLKGVRDDLETTEILMKSPKVAGLEFSETASDELLRVIHQAMGGGNLKDSIKTQENYKRENKVAANNPGLKFDLEDGLPVVRLPEDAKPAALIVPELLIEEPKKLPIAANDVKIQAVPAPFIAGKKIPETVLNSKTANRPNLDDVKFTKHLSGPIEELEQMTLIDFRRLAADPRTATGKIKEKIDLLAEQGLEQQNLGVIAWQKNEINRFYRLLGQTGMSEGKSIEDIIKDRLMSGKPTLTLDEFQAVMELNRQLRY